MTVPGFGVASGTGERLFDAPSSHHRMSASHCIRVQSVPPAWLTLSGLPAVVLACFTACSTAHAPPRTPLAAVSGEPAPKQVSLFGYPWTWTDETGAPAKLSGWAGVPLVVAGIYTQCKSTCPRTVARMRKVAADFRRDGRAAQFLLVTLDPDNDTPADLLRYKHAAGLPDSWHLLAGTPRDTQELTEVLDVHVLDDGPHLMHEAKIVIFDAAGMPVARFEGWALDQQTP